MRRPGRNRDARPRRHPCGRPGRARRGSLGLSRRSSLARTRGLGRARGGGLARARDGGLGHRRRSGLRRRAAVRRGWRPGVGRCQFSRGCGRRGSFGRRLCGRHRTIGHFHHSGLVDGHVQGRGVGWQRRGGRRRCGRERDGRLVAADHHRAGGLRDSGLGDRRVRKLPHGGRCRLLALVRGGDDDRRVGLRPGLERGRGDAGPHEDRADANGSPDRPDSPGPGRRGGRSARANSIVRAIGRCRTHGCPLRPKIGGTPQSHVPAHGHGHSNLYRGPHAIE